MGELTSLPNIGKALERQLREAGIGTVDELKKSEAVKLGFTYSSGTPRPES